MLVFVKIYDPIIELKYKKIITVEAIGGGEEGMSLKISVEREKS